MADPGRNNGYCKRSELYADHIDPLMSITTVPATEIFWPISSLLSPVDGFSIQFGVWRAPGLPTRECRKQMVQAAGDSEPAAGSCHDRGIN